VDAFEKSMKALYCTGLEPHGAEEKSVYSVANNDYGKRGIEQLRTILGYEGEFEYDAVAIEAVQQKRYAEMNLDLWFGVPKERTSS
jgi:hypothetical protein